MNIPEEAVEAAAKAQYECEVIAWDDGTEPDWEREGDSMQKTYRRGARAALAAAAPFIAAQALHDAADGFEAPNAHTYLRNRADELDSHE